MSYSPEDCHICIILSPPPSLRFRFLATVAAAYCHVTVLHNPCDQSVSLTASPPNPSTCLHVSRLIANKPWCKQINRKSRQGDCFCSEVVVSLPASHHSHHSHYIQCRWKCCSYTTRCQNAPIQLSIIRGNSVLNATTDTAGHHASIPMDSVRWAFRFPGDKITIFLSIVLLSSFFFSLRCSFLCWASLTYNIACDKIARILC